MGWNSDKTKKTAAYTMFGNDTYSAEKSHQGKDLWNVGVKGMLNLKRVAGKASSRRQLPSGGASQEWCLGNFLVVQWLGLCTLIAKGLVSTPGWGTKILQASWLKKKKKKKNVGKGKKGGKPKKKEWCLMGTGRRKDKAMKLELTSSPEEWRRGQWGPRSGLEGEQWKLVWEWARGTRRVAQGLDVPVRMWTFTKWNGEPSQDQCGLCVAGRDRKISWELVVTIQMRDVMVWICDGRRGGKEGGF